MKIRSAEVVLLFSSLFVVAAQAAPATQERAHQTLPKLEQFIEATLEQTKVPGLAVAIVFEDEVVFLEGFGVREVGASERVTRDTVFQLASMSKPIGSTAVAALVSDGVVTWDDHVSELDPSFAFSDPWISHEVTLRDLYSHHSGLYGAAGNDIEGLGFGRDTILSRLRYLEPGGPFRASYAYSNFSMTAGGVAAATAAGKTWETMVEDELYTPLGMTQTSSRHLDFTKRPERARLHILKDGVWIPGPVRNADAQAPAGGVSSSVNDMAKWMRLQLSGGTFEGERIVAEDALVETHQLQMVTGYSPFDGLPGFYGLGWNVSYDPQGRLRLGHSGAFSIDAGTNVSLVPAEQLGIVILSNGSPTGVPEGIATTFIDRALNGEPTQDWLSLYKGLLTQMAQAEDLTPQYAAKPTPSAPALPDAVYLGTYSNAFFGNIEVISQDDHLAIIQGPKAMTFTMTHFDRDTFTYVTEGESAVGTAGIFFHIGADSKATGVTVENLDIDGQGTSTRVVE